MTNTGISKRQIAIDFLQMTILFVLSVYFVYFSPSNTFSYLFFLIPLFLFWRSKANYFWFAYFFILVNCPAGFFQYHDYSKFHLPLYSIAESMSFTPIDLFVILALIKAIYYKTKKEFVFSKPLKLLLYYFVFITIPISWMMGTDVASFANDFRAIFFYSTILSFYWLNRDVDDLYYFGYLIIPYLLLIVYSQVFLMITDTQFISWVKPEAYLMIAINSISGEIRPVMIGVLIVFYSFIFGFQLLSNRSYCIFRGIAEIVITISFFSFVISSTRSWIAISILSLVSYYFIAKGKRRMILSILLVTAAFFLIINSTGLVTTNYIERNVWARIDPTIEAIRYGEISKKDTLRDRVYNDFPTVLEGIKESPLNGAGLSDIYRKYYSNDIGFLNTILLLGISGFIIFLYFLFSFYINLGKYKKYSIVFIKNEAIFISLRTAMLGIMLGYFATWDFFSFYPHKVFFISILIASAELTLFNLKQSNNLYELDVKE